MTRPGPEDFLELVQRAQRGRLKLYLGFAAGVGKTYRMLEEAHALRKRGVDVVLGFVETHGRAETEALVAGPRGRAAPQGRVSRRRRRGDGSRRDPRAQAGDRASSTSLPHTNVPGSRNKKRYQDVLELLDAGINVIGALNIQHLESLNDVVEQATGVPMRETVPDSFLKQADQSSTSISPSRICSSASRPARSTPPTRSPWALEHFFKDENLSTLRELALREVAESLERQRESQGAHGARRDAARGARPRDGVHVVVSAARRDAAAHAARGMAGRLNTDWFVVYVETPREAPDRIDAEAQRHLLANIELARELGAEVVRLQARDPVPALIDFARSHGVGHIVIGRSHQPWWRQLLGRSVPLRLVREAAGFDVHIVSLATRTRAVRLRTQAAARAAAAGDRARHHDRGRQRRRRATLGRGSQNILKDNYRQRARGPADEGGRRADRQRRRVRAHRPRRARARPDRREHSEVRGRAARRRRATSPSRASARRPRSCARHGRVPRRDRRLRSAVAERLDERYFATLDAGVPRGQGRAPTGS